MRTNKVLFHIFSSGMVKDIVPPIVNITGKLKTGMGSNTFITAEHILYGSPKLMVHLHILI